MTTDQMYDIRILCSVYNYPAQELRSDGQSPTAPPISSSIKYVHFMRSQMITTYFKYENDMYCVRGFSVYGNVSVCEQIES